MLTRNRFVSNSNSAAILSAALCAIACGGPSQIKKPDTRGPRIVRFAPGDELERPDQALELHFDRAMVGIALVGPALESPPLHVEPALPLDAHWEDASTLLVRPTHEWRAGERYALVLDAGLASVQGPRRFVFDAQPLRLRFLTLAGDNQALEPKFDAGFSLPVRPEDAGSHCTLRAADGRRTALAAAKAAADDSAEPEPSRVRFEVRQKLALHTRYTLECEGLTPLDGDAPFRRDAKASGFTTHGLLELARVWPDGSAALPPERAELCLELSTPVEAAELARHVHVAPAPDGLGEGWFEGACGERWVDTHRKNSVLLAPRNHFKVTVDAELSDVFGQRLGEARSFEFDTSDRVPGVWTATGLAAVLERGRPGHAFGALNLSAVDLRCAQLTPSQFATGFEALQHWSGEARDVEAEDRAKPPWELLGIAPRVHAIDAGAAPNAARVVGLDLGFRCGGRRGQAGLYALELDPATASGAPRERQGDDPARLVANVTDLGLIAKRGESSAVVFVARLSNGALVANAKVDLLRADGRVLASARTDARGLARLERLPARDDDELFAVRDGEDLAVVGSQWLWGQGLSSWELGVRPAEDDALRLFVHTDRGVYRPGERVLVHGLARRVSDTSPARVPEQRKLALTLQCGTPVTIKRELELSDFGSFSSDIALPAYTVPGQCLLEVELANKREFLPIKVAEFRPLTFELAGGAARDEVLSGEPVELNFTARYLFGAPFANAQIHVSVERAPGAIATPGLESFRFEDSSPALPNEEPWPHAPAGILLERTLTADAEGRAGLSFASEASRRPTRYLITAEATDRAEDRATRALSVLAHSAERYPGVRVTRSLFETGEPIQAELVVVDRHGKPIAGQVALELREERWNCKDPLERCTAEVRVLAQKNAAVSAERPTLVSFREQAQGSVHVRAVVIDQAGRPARASDSAWVAGGEGIGPYSDRVAAPLTSDRRRYAIGDRARVALETQLTPQQWLVTAERADLLFADVVPRAAGAPVIELGERFAPNVFLGLSGFTPRKGEGEAGRPRLVAGAREVKVEGPSRVLTTRIALANAEVRPKARVEGEVLVSHLGQPVAAEVAVVVVNESVLQLTGFATPDPTKVFHAPRGLDVQTLSNLPLVIADPQKAARVPEAAHLGVQGEDGGGGRPEMRNDYVAAAYFAPALRTDRDGRARFGFDAPTDLSLYRMMVVAAAKDDRVGSADAQLRVRQPLSAHPIAPRFVSRGDKLEIGALVHDDGSIKGTAEVRFRATGLALDHEREQVRAASGDNPVHVNAVVQDLDRARFEVELHKGPEADRVGRELVVRRPLDRELRVLAAGRAPRQRVQLEWPAGIDRDLSQLEVTADRAGLAPLAPLLAAVLDYPFGCTEQTAAALSALAAAPELARAIVPELANQERFRARIEDGVSRLLQAQSSHGDFGLYPGMRGRRWLSAFVLEAGLMLRAAGFAPDSALIDPPAAALSKWLGAQDPHKLGRDELELAAHVALLLARAGLPAAARVEALYGERERLSTEGSAYLLHAAALAHAADPIRDELRRKLRAVAWFARERDPEAPFVSAEREAALAILALAADAKDPQLMAALAAKLTARVSDPSRYLSTRDIADVLAALAGFARGTSAGAQTLRIGLGNRVLYSGKLEGAQVVALKRSAKQAPAGQVWIEADGELSASIRRRDVAPTADKPAFAHGLALLRRYLDPKTHAPLASLDLGQVVQVELVVRSERPLRMVALLDPLPAGLEPLDPGLASGRVAGCDRCNDNAGFDHLQRHDDRIEAFAEFLPTGTHTLRYLLRATTRGTFSAPGATAQLMYSPDAYARSATGALVVRAFRVIGP